MNLGKYLEDGFRGTLAVSLNNSLRIDSSDPLDISFYDSIGYSLYLYLSNYFRNRLEASLIFSLKSSLWRSLRRSK